MRIVIKLKIRHIKSIIRYYINRINDLQKNKYNYSKRFL